MTQLDQSLQIWQRPEWPYFYWDSSALLDSLVKVRHQQGRLLALTEEGLAAEFKNLKTPLSKERLCNGQGFRKTSFILDAAETLPPPDTLPEEIKRFLEWWNHSPVGLDGIIRAGLAYFWFITLQPLSEKNDLAALELVNLALAQDEKILIRPYQLKRFLIENKDERENLILHGQELNGDITLWLRWFFEELVISINESLAFKKNITKASGLNSRQNKIISFLLLQSDPEASITNRRCVELCQTSRESIKRDLKELVELSLLIQVQKTGRSVDYKLNLEKL